MSITLLISIGITVSGMIFSFLGGYQWSKNKMVELEKELTNIKNNDIPNLRKEMKDLESEMKSTFVHKELFRQREKHIDDKFQHMEERLDRIEVKIDKILERGGP